MKSLLYISFLAFFFSCSSESENLVGNYETLKSNKTEKWINYLTNKCKALGVTLELNKDSTYTINTCSYIANGNWKVKKDSLFLCETFKTQNNDSLLIVKNKNEIDTFLIKKKYFIQHFKSGTQDCILKLVRIE